MKDIISYSPSLRIAPPMPSSRMDLFYIDQAVVELVYEVLLAISCRRSVSTEEERNPGRFIPTGEGDERSSTID